MYIYRFINFKNEIIYIGKTKHLQKRLNTHFSNKGHLPDKCYLECEKIDILKVETEIKMDIYEIYLINKYNPKYNVLSNYKEKSSMNLEVNENWTEYIEFDLIKNRYRYIKEKETSLLQLKKDFSELKNIQDSLIDRIKKIENDIENLDKNRKLESSKYRISFEDKKYLDILNNILKDISDGKIKEGVHFRYEKNKELLALDLKSIAEDALNISNLEKKEFIRFIKKINIFEEYKVMALNGKSRRVYLINMVEANEITECYI